MANIGDQLLQPENGWRRYDAKLEDIRYKYNGIWNTFPDNNYYGGSEVGTINNGSYVEFIFFGTEIRIITDTFTNKTKIASITIDGAEDIYSQYGQAKVLVLVYEKTGLNKGFHKVKIKLTEPNMYVTLDAIDIDSNGYLVRPDYFETDYPELLRKFGVAWYDFDLDTKTIVSRYGSSMARGSISGNLTRGIGWLGQGGSLKGTGSSVYDRVEFDSTVVPSGDFTIRFKIKLSSDHSREICILSTRPHNTVATGIHISVAPKGLIYFYGNLGNNKTWNISSTLYTNDEIARGDFKWKDVVVTKTSGSVTISVNGENPITKIDSYGNIAHSSNLRLMSSNNTSNSQIKGEIDSLIILNKDFRTVNGGHSQRRVAVRNNENSRLYELNYNKNVLQNFNTNSNALLTFGAEFPEIAFSTDAVILNLNYKYDSYEEYADKVDSNIIDGANIVRYKIPPVDYYELVNHNILDKVLYYIEGITYYISNNSFVKLKDGLPTSQDFVNRGTGANNAIELDQLYGKDKPWIELLVSVVNSTLPTDGSHYKAKASYVGNNNINNKPQFSILDLLGEDIYSIVMYTEKEDHTPKVIVNSGNILSQIVEPVDGIQINSNDIDMFHVFAKSIGDTRYAVSFGGSNGDWFTFDNGDWKSVINSSGGSDVLTLENIPSSKWKEKLIGSSQVRFSYYITMTSELDSINVVISNRDKDEYANTSKYTMNYDKENKKINFNINQDGRYKVSYYDKE